MAADEEMRVRVGQLEDQLRRATWHSNLLVGVLTLGLIGVTSAAFSRSTAPADRAVKEVLRAREIDVVDQQGVTRVKIAAPLPQPIISGQVRTRGGGQEGSLSGMLLFDANGVERSGYATVDRGYSNVLFTLDAPDQQHALFVAEPNGATTLRLFNPGMTDRLDLAVTSAGPSISMLRSGREVFRQPER